MAQQYNDPINGDKSSIGGQIRTDFYKKKALIDVQKEMYFSQLADTTVMPKHFGKTIKCYHYLPLLDDANLNDQGIDAAGVIANGILGTYKVTIGITPEYATSTGNGYVTKYATGEATTANNALAAAKLAAEAVLAELDVLDTDYDTTKAALEAEGWTFDENVALPNTGNLYGSTKDIGAIQGKLPVLTENGGRVNRVGFTRIELEGTIQKLGMFQDYTKESRDFDTDDMLEEHVNREMLYGANEVTEDMLQIDLLNSAGVVRFGGEATKTSEVTGEGTVSEITYEDLQRVSIQLDDNRCPKMTKIITGSRMIDTKVIDAARPIYIGSELIPQVKRMVDPFGNQAFIPVQQYAAAGNLLVGEIGTIDQFRIIVVPEMMKWAGAGANVSANGGYRSTVADEAADGTATPTDRYDVFPMLCVGDGSFTTVGFQTDGKTVKFSIKHSKPEDDISYSANDPYGEKGFMSIKWYYGFMILRPERIALLKTVGSW